MVYILESKKFLRFLWRSSQESPPTSQFSTVDTGELHDWLALGRNQRVRADQVPRDTALTDDTGQLTTDEKPLPERGTGISTLPLSSGIRRQPMTSV